MPDVKEKKSVQIIFNELMEEAERKLSEVKSNQGCYSGILGDVYLSGAPTQANLEDAFDNVFLLSEKDLRALHSFHCQ